MLNETKPVFLTMVLASFCFDTIHRSRDGPSSEKACGHVCPETILTDDGNERF